MTFSRPDRNLKVAMLPLDIKLGDIRHNVAAAEMRIRELDKDTDLVVLPELFNIGFGDYGESPREYSEPDNGFTVTTMQRLADELNLGIIGGFMGRNGNDLLNRAFFLRPFASPVFYNKRHLFAGPEQHIFARGTNLPPILEFRSWRLKLIICYDLRFPVWTRAVNNDYDALVHIANWPNSRYYAYKQLLIARAIENQTYIAACNREGTDVYGDYARGDSMILNAMGYIVSTCEKDGTVKGTFDHEVFLSDRKKLQPWRVADSFFIEGVALPEAEQA